MGAEWEVVTIRVLSMHTRLMPSHGRADEDFQCLGSWHLVLTFDLFREESALVRVALPSLVGLMMTIPGHLGGGIGECS